ncbi:MAG: ABC transporter permease subunit [Rhodoplanes sp.]|uniref:ABC transporter permease n=1 Tax=Rhodoplanes sp. TaxID=1968906 RepID=UPI0017EFC750|nr:ABC transporter permease subunit [Rhodoplanes sp.]NVO13544.1 ABC transporter permease subunit [Rhodoplanes sp.]
MTAQRGAIGRLLGGLLGRLRAGWGTAASLLLLIVLWEIGHAVYGSLLLPSPRETAAALWQMTRDGKVLPAVIETGRDALSGFLAGVVLGALLGALAGLSEVARRLLQPIATLMLGIPAIAWVVLSLLWFGNSGLAVVFTVLVTCAPIVFASAAEGVLSLDGALRRMARAFRVPRRVLVLDVYLPHMLSYLFPAVATALALAWKVAVMTELLSGAGGIGDGLATARAQIDTAKAMAWILLVVALLLAIDHLLLDPLRRRMLIWRREIPGAALPTARRGGGVDA